MNFCKKSSIFSEFSSKGATPSEYGLVFGVIHLAIFVSGPFFGKFMHILGVRNVYFFGVLLTSVCAVSFGFLGMKLRVFSNEIKNQSESLEFQIILRTKIHFWAYRMG